MARPSNDDLHRCPGCGGWVCGQRRKCPLCRQADAVQADIQTLLDRATARAHRGALEAALPGTGYQHRPTTPTTAPQPAHGAHTPRA